MNAPAGTGSEPLRQAARRCGDALRDRALLLTAAESCTGGWIAKLCTDIAGSSDWFERGFVTYSNTAKSEQLGVAAATLRDHGAVSEQAVREMAYGALAHSRAQVAVAVSGIAGPGGGSADKPVGTVWLAWARAGQTATARRYRFDGDRDQVRRQAVAAAFDGLVALLSGPV